MEFLRKLKPILICVALAPAFVLAGQGGPTTCARNDLPVLEIPKIITPPYLVPPRLYFAAGEPDSIAAADPIARVRIIPAYVRMVGTPSHFSYRAPLSWRLNNPSTAPPHFLKNSG